MNKHRPIAHWRIIWAAILDFFTAFFVFGYAIGKLTGSVNDGKFQLNGLPAILCIIAIVLYFWVGKKFFAGPIWNRILKVS